MRSENITRFNHSVSCDPVLAEKVQAVFDEVGRATAEQLARLSTKTEAPFTAGEYLAYGGQQVAELSDEQLASVAGGAWEANLINVAVSAATLGIGCLVMVIVSPNERGHVDRCQPSGDPTPR